MTLATLHFRLFPTPGIPFLLLLAWTPCCHEFSSSLSKLKYIYTPVGNLSRLQKYQHALWAKIIWFKAPLNTWKVSENWLTCCWAISLSDPREQNCKCCKTSKLQRQERSPAAKQGKLEKAVGWRGLDQQISGSWCGELLPSLPALWVTLLGQH